MFHREYVTINGELVWFTKRMLRGKERHHSYVRTINISLEGAKIEIGGIHEFSPGSKARLQLGILQSDVSILDCSHASQKTTLRVIYKAPSYEFISYLEEQLPTITPNRQKYEGKWL